VHDVEHALYGTSLGVDSETGKAIEGGHRHHMRAINTICRVGGLRQAVAQGVLNSGVMYECICHDVDFVLAGSIRDDGPLPETVMDLIEAQERYAAALAGVKLVIVLSSMLHGIGVGNMLPSWVRMVCVDINPAVVTKLADRGSSQTVGIVTDVGLFLHQLSRRLVGNPD
jgi:lysine-ketoglutarate reductase/saccharopine dehydrogenase-like protein (TIGR00300 family)